MTTTHTPIRTQDLHVVLVALSDADGRYQGTKALSAPLAWEDAIKRWEDLDNTRLYKLEHGRDTGRVMYYMVRSVEDPRYTACLSKGYANAISRKGPYADSYGDDGIVKAAKAWAKTHNHKGAQGGWIYRQSGTYTDYRGEQQPDWKPVVQGWGSFAQICKRNGRIAQGADGLWYVLDRELVA
jgi:hypothetical protein